MKTILEGNEEQMKNFPNGFASWQETHFEAVTAIAVLNIGAQVNKVTRIAYTGGTCALYELAEDLTDKFEKLYEGRAWDGEFFDEIEGFLEKELH